MRRRQNGGGGEDGEKTKGVEGVKGYVSRSVVDKERGEDDVAV
jgi:hypothetical protein